MKNIYLLLDSALVPEIWHYLSFKSLSFEPLYRFDSTKIKSKIPYIIQLNNQTNKEVVKALLVKKPFHSGLIIQSEHTLNELAEKLGYFYHVINEKNEPFLQRYFELNVFPEFIVDLSSEYRNILFSHQTVFYYLDKTKMFYHKIYFQNETLMFDKVDVALLREEII